jgi:hypothetical protein
LSVNRGSPRSGFWSNTPNSSSLLPFFYSPLGFCSCHITVSCDLLASLPPLLIEGKKNEEKKRGGGGAEEGRLHHDLFLCTHHRRLRRLGSSWSSGQHRRCPQIASRPCMLRGLSPLLRLTSDLSPMISTFPCKDPMRCSL